MLIVGAITVTAILINFVLRRIQRPPYLPNNTISVLRQTYLLISKPLSFFTGKNK